MRKKHPTLFLILASTLASTLATLPLLSFAIEPLKAKDIPAEVKPFIEPNKVAVLLNAVDLNGDGLSDYLLVLQTKSSADSQPDETVRSLLLLTRQANKSLTLAKRSDKAILCAQCGGAFGDPLESITVGPKTFTIHHYGGSSQRWANSYKFNYSRRDNTWQLVQVDESSFNSHDPEKTAKEKTFKPPKHFGKIDFADFDPEKYLGQGEK